MSRLRLIEAAEQPGEDKFQWSLRPTKFTDYIGQKDLLVRLEISIKAAKRRGEPIDHVLLYGPPGLGKTTLAHIISNEMGSNIICTSGPAIERSGDLMGILTNLQYSDILFIDEIHRLPMPVEEFLYSAMEDFKIDFIVDKGPFAKTIKVNIKHFTLVGATTRAGLLSSPLRDRFGIMHHVDFYTPEELSEIIKRSSAILNVPIDDKGSLEIARRSRGTPRIANRLLRRVRDYAEVLGNGAVNEEIAIKSLELEGIDSVGLDGIDTLYLKTIIEKYKGGPAGIEAIAATLNEEVDTLQDMVEPYLLKIGYINRTPSGRKASHSALRHLGYDVSRFL
ncbi:MAG: Holliday junction ATP-dependent DNA helicase RuvB [Pelotomaculum sp. PtaU1.Bin035]|nr:MAG: Holliday junction ATP-dependent DNA helicase RuvB [Pelotomaculum sp. PtaU1.Bin035]